MTAATSNTRWSLVKEAQGDTPEARTALSELCAAYYAPVFGQMRRWLGSEEAGREVTQAFFAHLLAGNHLLGADARRGRFRSYLHTAARHFMIRHQRAHTAEKRGAGITDSIAELAELVTDETQLTPEAEYDRAWACAVIALTLEMLQAEMAAAGRGETFAILKPWLAGEADHGATLEAALRLGISETAVRVQLSRLRKRCRAILEQTLGDTLAPGADVQQEMRELMAALRS